MLLGGLLDPDAVEAICLSTTVPMLLREWERLAGRWAHAPLLAVGPGIRTGIPIRYDDPREVGPDRIVNSVAAKARFGAPVIVVDFGTSTNFDVVSSAGEYVGGVLAPGIETSMDALFARAARLVRVEYVEPRVRRRKDHGRGPPVGARLRVRGPGGRDRRRDPRGARGARRAGCGDGRACRARRAALGGDRPRRPVPHSRRPAHGLGAEPMIRSRRSCSPCSKTMVVKSTVEAGGRLRRPGGQGRPARRCTGGGGSWGNQGLSRGGNHVSPAFPLLFLRRGFMGEPGVPPCPNQGFPHVVR